MIIKEKDKSNVTTEDEKDNKLIEYNDNVTTEDEDIENITTKEKVKMTIKKEKI